MTEKEAREATKLEGGLEITGMGNRVARFLEGLNVAHKALEEIQQYRALGTVEELKEKQTSIARTVIEGEYFCPRCKYVMHHPGYCKNCGQHVY